MSRNDLEALLYQAVAEALGVRPAEPSRTGAKARQPQEKVLEAA